MLIVAAFCLFGIFLLFPDGSEAAQKCRIEYQMKKKFGCARAMAAMGGKLAKELVECKLCK